MANVCAKLPKPALSKVTNLTKARNVVNGYEPDETARVLVNFSAMLAHLRLLPPSFLFSHHKLPGFTSQLEYLLN